MGGGGGGEGLLYHLDVNRHKILIDFNTGPVICFYAQSARMVLSWRFSPGKEKEKEKRKKKLKKTVKGEKQHTRELIIARNT